MHWFAKHAKRHTVSALVETHGTALEIDLALAELSSPHLILCNPHHDRSVGGTCVVVAESFLRSGSGSEPEVVSTCIVPGRVQMVEILLREGNAVKKRLAVMVVHNFRLSKAEIRKICDMLDARAAASRGDPNAFQLWLAGDFNFPSRGELPTFAHDPHELMAAPTPSPTGGESDVPWRATLARLTEIGTDLPTHFTSSSNRLQRIDRIYYAQPSWLTVKQHTQAHVVSDPASMHARLLSDHAPVTAGVRCGTLRAKAARVIGKHILGHPRYLFYLQKLEEASDLMFLRPSLRLDFHKTLMREAADLVEGELDCPALTENVSKRTQLSHLSHIASVVAGQRTARAHKMIMAHANVAEVLEVVDGSVRLSDPASLRNKLSASRWKLLLRCPVQRSRAGRRARHFPVRWTPACGCGALSTAWSGSVALFSETWCAGRAR